MSDLSIRNLFIIPTILFLIVFNIFPLLYSLGYSFTDFRASSNAPANFVGLDNYRTLLNDPFIWSNFAITAKYVIVSVTGQVIVGFGVAMLLNRDIPFKGLITTLLLLPMMLSMAPFSAVNTRCRQGRVQPQTPLHCMHSGVVTLLGRRLQRRFTPPNWKHAPYPAANTQDTCYGHRSGCSSIQAPYHCIQTLIPTWGLSRYKLPLNPP